MKNCKFCGESMEDSADFCPKCGRLNTEANSSPEEKQKSSSGGGFDFSDKFSKFMGDNHTYEFEHSDIEENRVISALAYIPIIFFLPLIVCPNSRFGRFHSNQGLLILIFSVLTSILLAILNPLYTIPFVGIFLGVVVTLLSMLLSVASFGLMVYGLVNTLNGRAFELPVIGRFTFIK